MELGAVGVWWSGSWRVESEPALDAAAELEELGYGALWSTGGFNPGLSSRFGRLLASTTRTAVASGIVNIFRAAPAELAPAVAALEASYPGRFLLGLGASHAELIEGYERPYSRMVEYLDTLDSLEPTVPKHRRVLAALGPRMLELAAERSAGAHPYLTSVEHTARSRVVMGRGPLLAPALTAVVESDPGAAHALARRFVSGYLTLTNYTNNLRSLGFDDDDLGEPVSDRLVDAVVAWGDAKSIAGRIREHLDAGADHVCVQVVTNADGFPLEQYRELAGVVFGPEGAGRRAG